MGKIFRVFLFGTFLAALAALLVRSLDRATMEFLLFYALPAVLVCTLLLWRVLDPDIPAREPPLRVLLMRNVLQKHERRPPVPVTPSRVFQRRWDSKAHR